MQRDGVDRKQFFPVKAPLPSWPYRVMIMRKHLLLAVAPLIAHGVLAQTITSNIEFGGTTREYIRHVPAIYNALQPTPLVIVLHGLGDNMQNMAQVGFHQISDTANFIVLTPQALMDDLTQATAWNSGAGTLGIGPNLNVDDVGFISALIDSTEAAYNIDPDRIYVTGFSNGGFMSNRLACEMNDRIAAIASVAGTIGGNITCNPGGVVPVCHFHGTADSNVGYDGSFFGNSVAEWINFWRTNNACSPDEDHRFLANSANDGFSVETYFYQGQGADSRVLHYKVNGADHIWLGPQNDIFYSVEIWRFFNNYPLRPNVTGIDEQQLSNISLYPNPADQVVSVNLNSLKLNGSASYTLTNAYGQVVKAGVCAESELTIETATIPNGVYAINLNIDGQIATKWVLVSHQ